MYNTFTYYNVFAAIQSFLTAGFCALGYRNSRNSGWLLIIAASFAPVFRCGYNFIVNAIMSNNFPKPQPFFTYWDHFSKALFIIGIACLALVIAPIKEKNSLQERQIGFGQTVVLGWILPSTMLVLSLAVTLTIIHCTYFMFAAIQTIGIALPLLYICLCLVLVRSYSTNSDLIHYVLRLHSKMFVVGIFTGILYRYTLFIR